MAKPKINRAEYVRGMSVKSILSMSNKDFNKLSETELRHIVTRLASAGNKRLRGFEKAGERSPAYTKAMENGKFTAKNKTFSELRHEFQREKEFFTNKYSTVSKWLPLKEKLIKGLQKAEVGIDNESFYPIFDVFQKLYELDESVSYREFKYTIMKEIDELTEERQKTDTEYEKLTPKERAEKYALELQNRVSEILGKEEEKRNRMDATSDFFSLGRHK